MQQTKKMTLTQLTFLVTVNMMGSGIIMLPTNMAQVGAISLLSWLVTAVGSMAIAYGFAQAGIFNQRTGGMAAYAEDAYGKAGYFQVFFLYFLSLAIANVAVASSALGYLSSFFPALSATPVATCLGVIGLLWLTTVANFGGPKLTGRIGAVTVWGVILPVGFISIAGWFWFSGETFAAAWNPNGLSLFEGMGSSIALTLWAFLGMESASQNASAVENPKRDVPLACLFGTLGAAAIYILSTTAIQGIVPNAELANSTGPFGLAFAQMFSPAVGSIVMALAAMACVGSLLGWQFTLAQTAKDAADTRMFLGIFGKANSMGAPVAGMIIMGVVQSLLALSTISPNLSEQFAALVNLAVVTNVVPYLIALSALMAIMQAAGAPPNVYRRNVAIATVAMVYSVYVLYASGMEAVMGGMLVMGIGWIIWGFMAPRFQTGADTSLPGLERAAETTGGPGLGVAAAVAQIAVPLGLLTLGALPFAAASAAESAAAVEDPAAAVASESTAPAPSSVLERIRASGKITLGYVEGARPFSYRDESGNPAGYGVVLCEQVADAVKAKLVRPDLTLEWVAESLDERFTDVQQGRVDLQCAAGAATLTRRREVALSIPVFPGGVGAVLREDASSDLVGLLEKGEPRYRPFWRASPARLLTEQTFAVMPGTPAETWLIERASTLKIPAEIVPVDSLEEGVTRVHDREVQVFFADRALLLDVVRNLPAAGDLMVLDRKFTHEPVALGMALGAEDLRLLVDRTLSRMYRSGELQAAYEQAFGAPSESTLEFFRLSALPE